MLTCFMNIYYFCSLIYDTVSCLVEMNECSEEDTYRSVTSFLSFAHSAHTLGHMDILDGANYHALTRALTCDKDVKGNVTIINLLLWPYAVILCQLCNFYRHDHICCRYHAR